MLAKLKHRLANTQEKRRLFANIFSLGFLQGANYLFPLIIAPYLIRTLGPEFYGLIAFSAATVMYFSLLTDYGFNLSATSQISLHRDDPNKLNEIFSAVMIVKFGLMLISFLLLIILVTTFSKFSTYALLYFVTFTTVIGQFLFPTWFFQGMETMKYITYVNLITKALFTLAIFIFVQRKEDYLFVPLLTGIGAILSGLWTLYFIYHKFGIRFKWQPFKAIKFQLVDGWHIFLSTIVMSLYTVSTTFILGLFTNNTVVGYFAAADKVILAAKGLFTPVIQALYPMLTKKINTDKNAARRLINKITLGIGAYTLLVSIGLYLFAETIISILFGNSYQESILLLQIMAFLPLLIALSNIFGLLVMINFGYKKAFSQILTVSAILGLVLSFIFVPQYQATASAATVLIVETFVTVVMGVFLHKKRLFKLR